MDALMAVDSPSMRGSYILIEYPVLYVITVQKSRAKVTISPSFPMSCGSDSMLAMSWSSKQYTAFEDERTRPVRDLVSALPAIEARSIVDLGCGPGNSTEVLAARFPNATV